MDIKNYWFFIAGMVLVLILVAVFRVRPMKVRPFLPGQTQHHLYEGFANNSTFYMFGVDWCPHCVQAKPLFESLGSTVTISGHPVALQYVNPEKDKAAASGFEIDGYPTFYHVSPSGQKTKYSGPRNAQGFQDFLAERVAASA